MINNDTSLPKTGYLAFDALSMKAYLKQRLLDNGVFSDQIYEGSNLAQIIDVFAMTFQNLIFYMNKTGAEGLFSDAQIYENLNRITKALGYNPIGHQASILPIKMTASELLERSTYIIPRYSRINSGGATYSSSEDFVFSPEVVDDEGFLDGIAVPQLLFQGEFKPYKEKIAEGNDHETLIINPGDGVMIDHYNIHVYVKTDVGTENEKWHESTRTQSLYLHNAADFVHECRLNEDNYYEIKFGDDICGRKLKKGDIVQVFYLQTNGNVQQVSPHEIDGGTFTTYQGDRYSEIMADVRPNKMGAVITNANSGYVTLYNDSPSTYYTEQESVEDMRENAPKTFRSQYRLVTADDFKTFIKTNYRNVVQSAYVMNNWEYIQTYLRYLHSVGLKKPSSDTRMALNQFHFADACNFNNVYVFAVPKINSKTGDYNYIPNDLKSMILKDMDMYKTLTCEPVMVDPIYMGFGIGINENGTIPSPKDMDESTLVIEKAISSVRSTSDIKQEIIDTIIDFFSAKNNQLGEVLSITKLSQKLYEIEGIASISTQRKNKNGTVTTLPGISFVIFNETYPEIGYCTSVDYQLEPFMFPYYSKKEYLTDHIKISERLSSATLEY